MTTITQPAKKKNTLGLVLMGLAGALIVGCIACVGLVAGMDALGLLPTRTPTLTPTLTATNTPLPIATTTSTETSSLPTLISIGALILVALQLKASRRATEAQTYALVLDTAQREEVRAARRLVFNNLKGKTLEEWNQKEKNAAEIVCHTYDAIGQMVRNHYLHKKIVIENWGHSYRELWPILRPLVEDYRKKRNAPEIWNDFEWLAEQTERTKKGATG